MPNSGPPPSLKDRMAGGAPESNPDCRSRSTDSGRPDFLTAYPMMQMNLNKIGGLLMHDAVKLPETIDDI
jgi:hypothetical protein